MSLFKISSLIFICSFLLASSHYTLEITPADAPVFNIENYTWLAGSWKGNGFGGVSEETWQMPVDGTMMGMFRHIKDGKVTFYEFLLLDKTGMRLKHFHPDLKGWETKDEMVTFPMKSFTKDKLELDGLTFELKSDTEMEIRLRLNRSGEISTETFTMNRVKLK